MLRILSFVDTLALIFVVSMPPWIMLAHVFDLRFSPQFHNPFDSFLNVELPENGKELGRITSALCFEGIAPVVRAQYMQREYMCKHAATYSGGVCSVCSQHLQAMLAVQAVCARCASLFIQACVQAKVCVCKYMLPCELHPLCMRLVGQLVQAPAIASLRIHFVSQTFFRIAGVLLPAPF